MKTFKTFFLLRLLVFWLLLFAFYRLLFLLYHHAAIPEGMLFEALKSFVFALRLDFSTACAATILPFIFWSVRQFTNSKLLERLNNGFTILCISMVTLFSIGNIKIYEEWGTPLSARAFQYLLYPEEILSFMTVGYILLSFSIIAGCIFLAIRIYYKISGSFTATFGTTKQRIVSILIIPFLLLIGYRGGLQLAPINESAAYYSTVSINNHIATNNIWYLAHSIVEANDNKNPYQFMEIEDAKKRCADLFNSEKSITRNLLNTEQPNIVIIVLESWTADIIAALDGEQNVTPHFDELRKEGILFSQLYSSGFRTEQGLVSILSGFPAQPNNSIITTPSKAEKLPNLTQELIKQGYQTSFFYGGEIEFANMKSYLLNAGFENVVDKNSFEDKHLNSKWGAHDEYVFSKQLKDLQNAKAPFFSMLLTLSTHEPFEVTMKTPFNGKEETEQFKKAAYYTDHCISEYFKEAKKQPWYQNTLFILVADHGHRLPKNRNMNFPEGRKITGLITGGALREEWKDTIMDKICSQHDIPATILNQLGLPAQDFAWSKNIFQKGDPEFAYYSNENSLGWITPAQNIVYSFDSKTVQELQTKSQVSLNDSLLSNGKAYLQCLYDQYLNY